jgi:hypothetical protein
MRARKGLTACGQQPRDGATKEETMKQLYCLIVVACISLFAASGVAAQQYSAIGTQDGVKVMAAVDPLGPNNQIAVYIKFVNTNGYKVDITWTPVITCEQGSAKKGFGSPFSMGAGASYEVRLWRSSACGVGAIKDLKVEMKVDKAEW